MTKEIHAFSVRHRDVWSIALPASLAFITEPLVGLVDMTVIGRLGDAGLLGGLVLGSLAFDIIFSMAFFLRLGTAGLTAQSVGARDPDDGLVHLIRAIAISVALGIVLLFLASPIEMGLGWFLAPAETVQNPYSIYIHTRMWSAPFVLINFSLLGWFYGRAAAMTGMALQMLINGANIVLSIWFVWGLGWGVAGVALGTILAQAISMLVGLFLVYRHFRKRGALPKIDIAAVADPQALTRLFGLSRDLMIRSGALMMAFAWFTAQTSRYGEIELAANSVVLNFQMFTAFFLDGQAQAAEQICGKAVGANYRPAFERAQKLSILWGFVIAGALFVLWIGFGPYFINFATTNPDVRNMAYDYLFIASFTALTGVMAFVMDGVMTGATLNTIIRNGMVVALGIFLIAAIILQHAFGIYGLWAALHIFFLSRGVIFWLAVRAKLPALFPA